MYQNDFFTIDLLFKIGIVVLILICLMSLIRWIRKNDQVMKSLQNILVIGKDNTKNGDPPPSLHLFGRSRSETISINVFAHILHEKGYDWSKIIVGYRPDFLKNPSTGRPLEIDAYYPDLKVGIEYNGIQHYKFPNHIHPDTQEGRAKFDDCLQRDQIKHQLASENGVKIIEIPYHIDTCIPCNKNDGEWVYKKCSDNDKWNKIRDYLNERLKFIPEAPA